MLRQRVDHGDDPGQGLHLDRGYDSAKTRNLLELLGFEPSIATKGAAPIQPAAGGRWPVAGGRWPVERTHVWLNGYGKLRRAPTTLPSSASHPLRRVRSTPRAIW